MKILLLFCTVFSLNAAADIYVVTHPSNSNTLDKDFVARLFLGKAKQFPDGTSAIPLSQIETAAATPEFNEKVLGRNSRQLKAYWSQLVFTGKGTPAKEVNTDAEVIALVKSNPNLIGYVAAAPSDGSVKVTKLAL
jgi:ABC-type phosphate transport system substrate-binding protein